MWPCRSGKRLLHTALLQERCKCGGSILLAAVAVKCQIGRGISFAESYPKCTGDQIRAGIAGYAIADDFPGKEVENDAQIKPVIVELEVCNITDPCLIRMFCGKLLLQQVLLAVFLMLFKLLFGIKSNAAQIELLHDRSNALGADSDTTFGQCNANLFGTIPLAAVVESLLYQTHELCLLLVALAAVRTAKDVVVKCTASDIQCFAQLIPSGEYMMQQDKVAAQNAANLDYLSMMTGYDLPMEEQAEAQAVSVGDIEGEAVYDDTVDDPAYVATEEEENANE